MCLWISSVAPHLLSSASPAHDLNTFRKWDWNTPKCSLEAKVPARWLCLLSSLQACLFCYHLPFPVFVNLYVQSPCKASSFPGMIWLAIVSGWDIPNTPKMLAPHCPGSQMRELTWVNQWHTHMLCFLHRAECKHSAGRGNFDWQVILN